MTENVLYQLRDDKKIYEIKCNRKSKSIGYTFFDCEIKNYPRNTIICTNGKEWKILFSTYDYAGFNEKKPFQSEFSRLKKKDGYFLIEW